MLRLNNIHSDIKSHFMGFINESFQLIGITSIRINCKGILHRIRISSLVVLLNTYKQNSVVS